MVDSAGHRTSSQVRLTVVDVREERQLFRPEDSKSRLAPENAAFKLDLADLLDVEAIGDVVWSVSGPDAGQVTVDPHTGELRMAPKDYEALVDARRDNTYEITVHARDADGNEGSQLLSILVTDVREVRNFEVTGIPATEFIAENTPFLIAPEFKGAPIGDVTWTLSGPDAGHFSIDPRTGVVSMPARDYEAPLDAGRDNVYEIVIGVTDTDENRATAPLRLVVADEAVEVSARTGPADMLASVMFELPAGRDGKETPVWLGRVHALDPEREETVRYSIIGGNDAGLFEIVASNGELRYVGPEVDPAENKLNYLLMVQAEGRKGRTATMGVAVFVIDGMAVAGTVIEDDARTTVTGAVSGPIRPPYIPTQYQDSDFQATTTTGTYGTLTVEADGTWRYVLNNEDADTQALTEGEEATEEFDLMTEHGAAHRIRIDVAGANDAAVIGGTTTGKVKAGKRGGASAGGSLEVTDLDPGDESFRAQNGTEGTYGTFRIDANGQWLYVLDNDDPDTLNIKRGQRAVDRFMVLTADGTEQQVEVTVGGPAGHVREFARTSGLPARSRRCRMCRPGSVSGWWMPASDAPLQ